MFWRGCCFTSGCYRYILAAFVFFSWKFVQNRTSQFCGPDKIILEAQPNSKFSASMPVRLLSCDSLSRADMCRCLAAF